MTLWGSEDKYRLGNWLTELDREKLAPKYDKNNGRTITLYVSQEDYEQLHNFKKILGCKTWDCFVKELIFASNQLKQNITPNTELETK